MLQSKGLTAAELTVANLDKSRLLDELIAEKFRVKEDDLLGELQVTLLHLTVLLYAYHGLEETVWE